jgi:UDP-N-acetylglucosamine 2-epimerase (non-hydrolysing)
VRDRWKLPIIVSTHPRTRQRLESLDDQADLDGIDFSEPFGFHDYNHLQLKAFCVLSDSGSISEESSILRFPAVTLRSSIERPEALDSGSIIMSDLRYGSVIAGVEAARADYLRTDNPREYEISDCSVRVRNFILSTAYEHAVWSGLR